MYEYAATIRGAWTAITFFAGLFLASQFRHFSGMAQLFVAMACVVVWLLLFLPSLLIWIAGLRRAFETAARCVLLYDGALLCVAVLATQFIRTPADAVWYSLGTLCLGAPLAIEVASARQELAHDPDAWRRAARVWIAGVGVVLVFALVRGTQAAAAAAQ